MIIDGNCRVGEYTPTLTAQGNSLQISGQIPNARAKNYRIYGNSVQDSLSGKNLFNLNSYTVTGNPTYTIEDGRIIASCNFTNYISVLVEDLDPTKEYTISRKILNNSAFHLYISDADGEYSWINTLSDVVTPTADGTLKIQFRGGSGEYLLYDQEDIQIELGSTATSYEPYYPQEIENVGKLVTSGEYAGKYKIDVEVYGKNLLNPDNMIFVSNFFKTAPMSLTAGTYTVSLNAPNTAWITNGYVVKNGVTVYSGRLSVSNKIILTYNLTEDAEVYFQFNFYLDNDYTAAAITDNEISAIYNSCQIELGSTATSYEPYQGSTTTIYLDEPLRKSLLSDEADYIDFINQKVVRKVDADCNLLNNPIEESITCDPLSLGSGTQNVYVIS